MRIIAGSARGRPLVAPAGDRTRPMLDMQKEKLFNILQSSFPCGGVLDVFAGSGALGLEALSRGAESATFVERARPAAEVIKKNIAACRFDGRARVLQLDAFKLEPARIDHPLGLVFLDPPFPLWRESPAAMLRLAALLMGGERLEDGALMMLRIPADAEVTDFPAPLVLADRRPSGESVILLLSSATVS